MKNIEVLYNIIDNNKININKLSVPVKDLSTESMIALVHSHTYMITAKFFRRVYNQQDKNILVNLLYSGKLSKKQFQKIIDLDININKTYALKIASNQENIRLIKKLIVLGANVNSQNDYCLRLAIIQGNSILVRLLYPYRKITEEYMRILSRNNGTYSLLSDILN